MKAPKESQSEAVQAGPDTHEPEGTLQRRVDESPRQQAQRDRLAQLQADGNRNDLPPSLRSGIESLSGLDMGDVRVHRNSARPAQLQAHAYAQGSDIYLAPGQEKHLPHEAWHVVQQKQGRVRATVQRKGEVGINDDAGLEREADAMGSKASHHSSGQLLQGSFPQAQLHSDGSEGVAQLRNMHDVMNEQRRRETVLGRSELESYTTVGFEWDIAKTAEHSDDTPNILQGLTHLELAASSVNWNGLPYVLETDAGNTLEFVTPPFFIHTRGPGSTLPDPGDLDDVIGSTREALTPIVQADETLGALMENAGWAGFEIGNWGEQDLAVSWRNWSPRAQDKGTIAQHLPNWRAVRIAAVTVAADPQINIAATARDYDAMRNGGESRFGGKKEDVLVSEFNRLSTVFQTMVSNHAIKKVMPDIDRDQADRFRIAMAQLAAVLAQQSAIPSIRRTAELQKAAYDHGQPVVAFDKAAGPASYVKDNEMVWLKTDLFTFFSSVLVSDDWGPMHLVLVEIEKKLPKADIGGKIDRLPLINVVKSLAKHAESMAANRDTVARGNYIRDQFEAIGKSLPEFNDHRDAILGVRQDTFLKPLTMVKLSKKLGMKKLLSVVEVRNTAKFLEWLKGKKSGTKSLKSVVGVAASAARPVGAIAGDDSHDRLGYEEKKEEKEEPPVASSSSSPSLFHIDRDDDIDSASSSSSGPAPFRIEREGGVSQDIMESVSDFLRRSAHPPQGTVFVVSGDHWTCYIRAVLHHFAAISSYEAVIKRINEAEVKINSGVTVGSDQERAVVTAIAAVTGRPFYVHAVDVSHGTAAVTQGADGARVDLVLTGVHFSLLRS